VNRLLPSQLRALIAKYEACPGIVRGIIAAHVDRGGDQDDAIPRKCDIDDYMQTFDGFFGGGR